MDQVNELLDTIATHKEMGVTGASVMFSFFKCRVQPIQQHHTLRFEYMGAEDPSRMCAEELTDEAPLIRVKRVLMDVNTVPYVPGLFSARSPPKSVIIRLLLRANSAILPLLTENLLQGLTELYRSYPPQPDIPDRTTFFPALRQRQKELEQPKHCRAARPRKARAPRWKGKPRGRREGIAPPDNSWS
jgi:hypothetical protein